MEVVILKKEFPILEFDSTINAIIEPKKIIQRINIPENVVIYFFNDVIVRLRNEWKIIESERCNKNGAS